MFSDRIDLNLSLFLERKMRGIIYCICVAFLFLQSVYAQDVSVVIIYTHNTNAVFENCDCPDNSYGGLEKRAAVIDSIRRAEKNVLLVDCGDMLDIFENHLLHEYIVRAYRMMKYDFWTAGDQDFVEGISFFTQDMGDNIGQLISSNIRINGKNAGQTNAIRTFGKIRIGLTGTIRKDVNKYLDAKTKPFVTFEDQVNALRPVITDLEQKADYIILLSHSGDMRDTEIAAEFPQIDLIIGGHSQTLMPEPLRKNNTLITQVGESGHRLGVIKLDFSGGKISSVKSRVILLKKEMKSDPNMDELIKAYHAERSKK